MHASTFADTRAAPQAPGRLARLFAGLHAEEIRYCHWKGTEHLERGWSGASDVDLLFDVRRRLDLQRILAQCGFKRFSPRGPARIAGVEDYLGFDDDTGTLLHLHAHYRLVLAGDVGGPYFPPWDDAVLATRRFDERRETYVADPGIELVLLLLRAALDVPRIHRRDATLPAKRERERLWLLERVGPGEVEDWARRLLGEPAAATVVPLLGARPSAGALRRFRRAAAPRLNLHASSGPWDGLALRTSHRLARAAGAANRRWWRRPWALRRVDPAGGLVIAILGADGSGKSTLTRALSDWLSWKLDVYRVYHGSGSGSSSWLRWPMVIVLRLRNAFTGRRSRSGGAGAASQPQQRGRMRAARAAWGLALAWEKRGKLRRTWRARNRGLLVVTDRYPQDQVTGINDGPLLSHWSERRNPLLRWLAAWERTPYRWATYLPPDLVIKLEVDPRVAFERKAEDGMGLAQVARRVETVASLRYAPERTAQIDVNRPLPEVVLDVKRAVWERL